MTEDSTAKFLDAAARARTTYDQVPQYHPSLVSHPVYKEAPMLFDKPVNAWDLADGTGFLETVREINLAIKNVQFINWNKRDAHGAAALVVPSSYMFDSRSNAVKFVDMQGNVHQIPVAQYGVVFPQNIQTEDRIAMRVGGDIAGENISVTFALQAKTLEEKTGLPGIPPSHDTNRLFVVTSTPMPDTSRITVATHRHADYYINMLLILDPEKDQEKLDLEMGQIAAAVRRLGDEEAGSLFHPRLIEIKLRAAAGDFVEKYLAKLVQDNIHTQGDLDKATTALALVVSRKAQYPANTNTLQQLLEQARKRLTK
jgi:hypothetical protein